MYFHDRSEAGDLLAKQLMPYRFENTTLLALSPGGVLVGAAIAKRLHCSLSLLLTSRISAPGEVSLVLGTIDHIGTFSYNNLISPGQMEEYLEDFHLYLEEEKLRRLFSMTSVLGHDGLSRPELLAGRDVIIVTDGVKTGLSFEAAFAYLRHVPIQKMIAAIPVCAPEVIDHIRVECDETYYLYIPDTFITPSHYYDEGHPQNTLEVLDHINRVVTSWH